MKIVFTLLLLMAASTVFAQSTADLNGVTFGFGAGYSRTFNKTYDYSLTTDASHNLKLQPLNKGAFVISSVVMVKLGKIAVDPKSDKIIKQSKKSEYEIYKADLDKQKNVVDFLKTRMTDSTMMLDAGDSSKEATKKAFNARKVKSDREQRNLDVLKEKFDQSAKTSFADHLSINLSLDLANIAPSVSFNKSVNGGLGIGYFINDNLQMALFYDVSQVSQLRDYVVNSYMDKPIPKGDGSNYNALDAKDASLFYNKTVSGVSLKLIFSIANKKQTN